VPLWAVWRVLRAWFWQVSYGFGQILIAEFVGSSWMVIVPLAPSSSSGFQPSGLFGNSRNFRKEFKWTKLRKTQFRRERLGSEDQGEDGHYLAIASCRTCCILSCQGSAVGAGDCPSLLLGEYWRRWFVMRQFYGLSGFKLGFSGILRSLSLGQALFFGVGLHAGALNTTSNGRSSYTLPVAPWWRLICTIILSPVIRLKGVYFAMVAS